MNAEQWFSQMLEEARGHPDFVAETVSLQIISDLCKAMKCKQMTKKQLAAVYKKRKDYRRRWGFRAEFTEVKVHAIKRG